MSRPTPTIDLNPNDLAEVKSILKQIIPDLEVWAFGSRVKWTAKSASDLDLAIITQTPLSLAVSADLNDAFDESDLPMRVDIVDWSTTSDVFREIIKKEKVVVQEAVVMSVDWPLHPLAEIVEFKTGRLDSNASEDGGEYPFFTCSPTTLAINTFAFDNEAVLLAGNNANGVFAVKYYKGKFNAYQRTYVITPKDKNKVSVRWLYFRIKHVTSELQQMSVGTATKFLTRKILDAYEVSLPPYEEQERVAGILWSLQDKIDVNSQTNQTLENIAQAIFKSWFVDFDPTRAKITAIQNGQDPERAAMAAISGKTITDLNNLPPEQQQTLKSTAALFPDTMVDSELGEIPKGWGIQKVEDVIELAYGKALKKTDRISGKIPVYGSGGLIGTHKEHLVKGPGIIVGRKGTVGALYWEDESFYPIDTVFYVKHKKGVTLIYSYYLLQTLGLEKMNTDAAVPGLNRNNAYRLEIPKVPTALIDIYSTVTNSFRIKMSVSQKETKNLIGLRDSLLPKLLSGEVDVPNIKNGEDVE